MHRIIANGSLDSLACFVHNRKYTVLNFLYAFFPVYSIAQSGYTAHRCDKFCIVHTTGIPNRQRVYTRDVANILAFSVPLSMYFYQRWLIRKRTNFMLDFCEMLIQQSINVMFRLYAIVYTYSVVCVWVKKCVQNFQNRMREKWPWHCRTPKRQTNIRFICMAIGFFGHIFPKQKWFFSSFIYLFCSYERSCSFGFCIPSNFIRTLFSTQTNSRKIIIIRLHWPFFSFTRFSCNLMVQCQLVCVRFFYG